MKKSKCEKCGAEILLSNNSTRTLCYFCLSKKNNNKKEILKSNW